MKDTPGWASPGSAPSDGQGSGASGPADRPGPAEPAEQPGPAPQDTADAQGGGSQWSRQQPPPGQWSAPAGPGNSARPGPPPPPPGPGWGSRPHQGHGPYGAPGHPAWGGGWGGPPPAAKPGVIPLRPLGVGEILDGAVSTMRTYWRTVLGISLTVAVVTEIIVILLRGLVLDDTSTAALDDPSATAHELTRALGEAMLSSGAIFLVSLVATVAATALLTSVTSRAVLGRPVTTGEAWRDARPQVLKLLGLILLLLLIAAAIVFGGMLPGILVAVFGNSAAGLALAVLGGLGGGVVALWLMIRFSLASPALMLEKRGVVKSMSRSAKLVRGSWWRVFGILLLAGIIANIISAIVVIPFTLIAAAFSGSGITGFLTSGTGDLGWTFLIISGIGSVIGSMITYPINAGVTVLLYVDQRIRREALDLELARAAGLEGYGADAGSRG
ncbi:glycerophosphoryl diester phosphodiesterase membrane domain-containing protein [Streptomyces sediminimaris]|uniref:glycerophosphoryl diester phosphodiesterase membrane domain-containing protein n=1 Tax=Streptomyces sediminimaris TaxID=3383721 RepID=UPI00399A9440